MTAVPDWTELGLRPSASLSARTKLTSYSPMLGAMLAEVADDLTAPFRGIAVAPVIDDTTPKIDVAPLVAAAHAFLDALPPAKRAVAALPIDAIERRQWFNVHPHVLRHGVMLEDLNPTQRHLALVLIEATLSARGFRQARDIMRINELLVSVTGKTADFGEWPYFLSFFGTPHRTEPWAWQLDGHHLNVNASVADGHLCLTPTFMGSEPCHVDHGDLAGTRVFAKETAAGVALLRSLDEAQLAVARPVPSILRDEIPEGLSHPIDGRMRAGAFKDNATVDHAGIRATDLTDAQRALLLTLIGAYVGWGRLDHANARLDLIARHLDETSVVWMGSLDDDGPFYYRVLNPLVLIEFDHHPGIVFDNLEPSRHHVHTVVRTPNGGDYGRDLLAEHLAEHDHSG